jgi:heme exporter protein A
MEQIRLKVSGLKRVFNRRTVFSGIGFEIGETDSLAVTGRNGSGKSTLLKIVAGILSPTRGSIELSLDSAAVSADWRYRYIGFVAPYLQLYDEFSAIENLEFFKKARGLRETRPPGELLGWLGLEDRKNDPLRTYSSGMKQRVKYAFALLHDPPLLLLDEPTSNLDAAGIEIVYRIIEEQKKRGIVIVATNNQEDFPHCARLLNLDSLKPDSPGMPVNPPA